MKFIIDFSPLFRFRDYRYLYLGQFVSFFGSALTMVAIPFQIYQITHSSVAVGNLGLAQVIPLVLTALYGGAVADSVNRKRLLLVSEFALMLCSGALFLNAASSEPRVWVIYLCAGMSSAIWGFHRPAFESLNQQLLPKEVMAATGALSFLKFNVNMILGSAISGWLIAHYGVAFIFGFDFFTFLAALIAIAMIQAQAPLPETGESAFEKIKSGIKYARDRQEILGSYFVDFAAMVFGMPMALFPALAVSFGGAQALSWLYSGIATGACLSAAFAGQCARVRRQGAGIAIAAAFWGVGIVGFGLAPNLKVAFLFLVFAGLADGISAILRSTLWNQTIAPEYRGRLASLEMISFASGPLLGNARTGYTAAWLGNTGAIVAGGIACISGVGLVAKKFKNFWNFKSQSIV